MTFAGLAFLVPLLAGSPSPRQPPAAPQTGGAAAPAQANPAAAFFARTVLRGLVDVYYSYDSNQPAGRQAQLRSYDGRHDSIDLALAELSLEKTPTADSRAGFRIDLDYGSTTVIVRASEPGGTSTFENIGQAYLSFLAPAGSGLRIDVGKFYTPIGNEVVRSTDDWNYSRSLLFTLGEPTYHMGVRVAYAVNDRLSLAADLVNGWNDVVDNNAGKTITVGATVKPSAAWTITENYMGGPEQADDDNDWRHLSDTVVSYTATKTVSAALNYDYGRDTINGAAVTWQGAAGYLRVQPVSWFAVTPRVEHYRDPNGFTTGTAQTLNEVTLTAEFSHRDGVTVRLEYRRDLSNQPVFSTSGRGVVDHQGTFTVGVLYAFSSRRP
jgi:Putative beta-barrel porin-2, OmpL-like. bbp2